MQRTKVLLVFGGESSEHEVSISSARNVFAAINEQKYEVILGYIDRGGRWWLLDDIDNVSSHGGTQLVPVLGRRAFMTLPSTHLVVPDVILPVLHGKNGEDGSLAALGQLLHIPVVGCDMTAGAVCMDKRLTKQILLSYDIPVVPYVAHAKDEEFDFNKLTMTLGCPLFVKPARAGSSVGVSKVHDEEELGRALLLAHEHDDVALIERAVVAREIEVAVLGSQPDITVSTPGEIVVHADFYSYDAKYNQPDASEVHIPAELPPNTQELIRTTARRAYEKLGCTGLARIDCFVLDEGMVYVNEVNTLPGFTNISMYPKLLRHGGIGYSELIDRLIADAILRVQQ
jgi:D-alanine-D-alanine ligase